MSATKLVVAVALLLSATSAALAQGPQCYGDRPYYDFYGILASTATSRHPPVRIPADAADTQLLIASSDRYSDDGMGRATLLRSVRKLRRVGSITIAGAPSPCPAAQVIRSHVDSRHRSHGRMPSNPADQRSPTRV